MVRLKLNLIRNLAIMAVFMAVVAGGALHGHASKSDLVDVNIAKTANANDIVLTQGMADVVTLNGNVADVMVANPSIVDVSALKSNKLYLVGTNIGTTNIITVDESGNVIKRFNVHVKIDDAALNAALKELFPDEAVELKTLTSQLILSGTVSSAEVANSIAQVVNHYVGEITGNTATIDEMIVNLLKVRGKSQVTLRVKVMEVSRNLLRETGVDTDIADLGFNAGGNIRNNPDLGGILGGVVSTGITQTPFATFGLLESFGAFGPVDTVITLLEDEGMVKVLAEPNLTAISGETAGFLAGGEFPVPSGRDNDGNIEITFRQFGVALNFAPVVLSDNRVSLQLQTEVSSLAQDNAVTLNNVQVPGLDVRRATTTVEMGSGASLMIAGLLQSESFKTMSGLPGLLHTPILGELFQSENFRRNETELVILVTPYLVEPFADKKQAKKVPMRDRETNYLEQAFAMNVRRIYGEGKAANMLDGEERFGYILD